MQCGLLPSLSWWHEIVAIEFQSGIGTFIRLVAFCTKRKCGKNLLPSSPKPEASGMLANFMEWKFNESENMRLSLLAMCMYMTFDPLYLILSDRIECRLMRTYKIGYISKLLALWAIKIEFLMCGWVTYGQNCCAESSPRKISSRWPEVSGQGGEINFDFFICNVCNVHRTRHTLNLCLILSFHRRGRTSVGPQS